MLGGIGDAEADYDLVQEGRARQRYAAAGEIGAGVKHELIDPSQEGGTLEQGGIAAAIGIRDSGGEGRAAGRHAARAEPVEVDPNTGGWKPGGGIENMRCQLPHSRLLRCGSRPHWVQTNPISASHSHPGRQTRVKAKYLQQLLDNGFESQVWQHSASGSEAHSFLEIIVFQLVSRSQRFQLRWPGPRLSNP